MTGKIFIVLLALLCVGFVQRASAVGGDFVGIDFIAAAPYTYNHTTGGGAYNDRTIGEWSDTVESLEGKQFKCGDIITHFVRLEMEAETVDETQSFYGRVTYLADSTGQSGVAYCDVTYVGLNHGDVENGATVEGQDGGGVGVFAPDAGVQNLSGNEEIVWDANADISFSGSVFKSGSELSVTFGVNGLEAGEIAMVRLDSLLCCQLDSSPTGNLQAALDIADSVLEGRANDAISGGQQTIPLKTVAGVREIESCTLDGEAVNGVDFKATAVVTSEKMTNDGFVTNDFAYSWDSGAYVLDGTQQVTKELHTFDVYCTLDHDGEYLYSSGECGCEETFIGANQPQLFYDPNANYYNPGVEDEVRGIAVLHYTRVDSAKAVTDLYLTPEGVIVRAIFQDGRVIDFYDVVYVDVEPATFESPGIDCTCKRKVDIMLVLEKSEDVTTDGYLGTRAFVEKFVSNYDIGSANAQIGVLEFAEVPNVLLALNDGNVADNVINTARALTCDKQKRTGGCGAGVGLLAPAIDAAVAEIKASKRTAAQQAIVVVTNGWNDSPSSAVKTAVDNAYAEGITVFVVAYSSSMTQSQMLSQTSNGDPDHLIQRWDATDLAAIETIDINSRVCLVNTKPCGGSCCGHCDSTCGTCIPVDDCGYEQKGCFSQAVVAGSCCVLSDPVDLCEVPEGECATSVCDAESGECVVESTCVAPEGDNCNTYECVEGKCIKTPLTLTDSDCSTSKCVNGEIETTAVACPADTQCLTFSCVEGKGCVSAPIEPVPNPCKNANKCTSDAQCTDAPSGCFVGVCEADGTCSYSMACGDDDNNACTSNTCVDGQCVDSVIDCEDGDKCTINSCDALTGACLTSPLTCDDNIACTVDSCDPASGCKYEPKNDLCNDGNPCRIGTCSATAGCEYETKTCDANANNACIIDECIPYEGCSNTPVECTCEDSNTCSAKRQADAAAGKNPTENQTEDCFVQYCDESGGCAARTLECSEGGIFATEEIVAVAAGIGAGVIVGIVAAVVIGLGVCGGASLAVYKTMDDSADSAITNNPLYEGRGNEGQNPLYRGSS